MDKETHIILAIHVTDRMTNAVRIQELFSEFGCHIKTRLGLHTVSENFCSPNGLIILELVSDKDKACELEDRLNEIEGVEAKKIVFEHRFSAQ